MTLAYTRFISIVLIAAIDLNSYCKGLCSARYQDGFYSKDAQRCGCVDYFIVNTTNSVRLPNRAKKDPEPPHVYDGVDNMKYAPSEPDGPIPPTAPMDF